MINENDVNDYTNDIREKKHSELIRNDVTKMIDLKKKYPRLISSNPKQFDAMLTSQCNFLFNNYTDIFNKVKKIGSPIETSKSLKKFISSKIFNIKANVTKIKTVLINISKNCLLI